MSSCLIISGFSSGFICRACFILHETFYMFHFAYLYFTCFVLHILYVVYLYSVIYHFAFFFSFLFFCSLHNRHDCCLSFPCKQINKIRPEFYLELFLSIIYPSTSNQKCLWNDGFDSAQHKYNRKCICCSVSFQSCSSFSASVASY